MLMRKFNEKGFTLAELLIVVAIIAVLVAVSIPVFTTQLEKSREETDIANLRSAYAIVQTDAMTEGYKQPGSSAANGKYTKGDNNQYIAYYNIKAGELSNTNDGAKGKGSATKGGCEELTGHINYNEETPGNTTYLTVVIYEENNVAKDVQVGFTDKNSITASTKIGSSDWK